MSWLGVSNRSISPAVVAGGSYTATDALYNAKYLAILGDPDTANKFVATTGSDSNPGTKASPYLTIQKAVQNITGGQMITVEDGTYTGAANWINAYSTDMPAGTFGNNTVIRARNPFKVRLTQTSDPGGYYQGLITFNQQYCHADGFILDKSWTVSPAPGSDGNVACAAMSFQGNCKFSRIFVKNKCCNRYGGWFAGWTGDVFEDCHGFGSFRYGFQGPGDGTSTPLGQMVYRRCTGYGTSGQVYEPTAVFNFYGAEARTYALIKDVAFLNCIAYNSPNIAHQSGQPAEDEKWGDWYWPKSVRNQQLKGCISINGGGLNAAFAGDGLQGNTGLWVALTDCAVWKFTNGTAGNGAMAFWHNDGATNTISNCTFGVVDAGATYYTTQGATVTNSLMQDTGTTYICKRQSGNGSNILYTRGPVLSAWNETNFDVEQTDLPLWPFPYESIIKSIVSGEPMAVPSFDFPTSPSTTADPFSGNNLGGVAKTLTSLVWDVAGTAMPSFAPGAGVY